MLELRNGFTEELASKIFVSRTTAKRIVAGERKLSFDESIVVKQMLMKRVDAIIDTATQL